MQNLVKFYEVNEMIDVLEGLPTFLENIGNVSMVFYAEQKFMNLGSNPFCYVFDPGFLVNQLQNFTFCSDFIISFMIYSLFCYIFMVVNIIFLFVDVEERDRDRFIKEKKCFFHSFHLIPYIMCILFICEYQRLPADQLSITQQLIPYLEQTIQQGCFGQSMLVNVMQDLQGKIQDISQGFYNKTKYLGILSIVFLIMLMLLRSCRGFYGKEVKQIENTYLEAKYMKQNLRRNNLVEDPLNIQNRDNEEEGWYELMDDENEHV